MNIWKLNLPLSLALAAALSATPALAQNGNGKGKGNDRPREEVRDERRDRDDDDGWSWGDVSDDRRRDGRRQEPRLERRNGRGVPPGWCQGRGNPHNTVENCGHGSDRYDALRTDGRYDARSGGSYAERHAAFHRSHDARCRELRSRAPLDLAYQVRIRQQCAADHAAWHRQAGVPHR